MFGQTHQEGFFAFLFFHKKPDKFIVDIILGSPPRLLTIYFLRCLP